MPERLTSTAWVVRKLPSSALSIAYSAIILLLTSSARLLLPGPVAWEWFCPEASRCSTTSCIFWADSTPSRTEGKGPTRSGSLLLLLPGYRSPLFCLFRWVTYPPRPSAASSTRVGAAISRLAFLPIRPTPLFITRWRIRSARLRPYRERQGRRGRLISMAICGCWAVAEPRPTHPTKWTSIIRALTCGRSVFHSTLPGATSPLTRMAQITSGWRAAMPLLARRTPWKSSSARRCRRLLLQLLLRRQRQRQHRRPPRRLRLPQRRRQGLLRRRDLRRPRGRARLPRYLKSVKAGTREAIREFLRR